MPSSQAKDSFLGYKAYKIFIFLGGFMSTGSTSASSSTLTSSSGGAGAVHNGQYHLPETFVDEHGFQRNLSDHHHSRNTGNAVTKTLIR